MKADNIMSKNNAIKVTLQKGKIHWSEWSGDLV